MSKFKVWIDDNKVLTGDAGNVMTSDVLDADVQRINGFKSGTDVSSQRVNSMIRQNSLVSKALMDLSGDNTLDATSSVSNVINIIKKSDNHTVNFTQASALSNIASGEKLSTSFGKINKQFDTLGNFMKYSDPDQFGDGKVRMTSTNSQNCVQDSTWDPMVPNSGWKGFEIEEENRELILNDVSINGVINKVNPYIICMKKALFVGPVTSELGGDINITLNEKIKKGDTIEIEFVFNQAALNAPVRMIVQCNDLNSSSCVPMFYVHSKGYFYLNVVNSSIQNNYSVLKVSGWHPTTDNLYSVGFTIYAIYKIHYKSNAS